MSDVFTVVLPDIGEGVVEGEVIEWIKKEGDSVGQDEPVVVVMTDKATVELPAPYPGSISKHYYQPGQIAIKDEPLYDISVQEGVLVPAQKKDTVSRSEEKKASESPQKSHLSDHSLLPRHPAALQARAGGVLASPKVRKLARDMGIDLSEVRGTGKAGVVTLEDLRAFASEGQKKIATSGKPAQPFFTSSTPILDLEGDSRELLMGMRNAVAERMVESKYLVPHFSFFDRVDATRLVKMRAKSKEEASRHGIRLTYMPFFVRALSLALKEFPQINGSIDVGTKEIVTHKVQNIGIAVKTPQGVMAPPVKSVEEMGFHDVIRAYDVLMQKAKENTLTSADMKGGTITISNFGTEGGLWATPVINYPQVCILGIARIQPTPVVYRGELCAREMLNLSWSFDHRLVDGDLAAAFSRCFCRYVENPSMLL